MKKAKAPGLVSGIEKEVEKTVETGKEQVSLGEAFNELLRQIFGDAKPLSHKEKKELEEEENAEKRRVRAKVLEDFMPTPQEERVYYQKQKEEMMKKVEKKRGVEKKTWEASSAVPKGRKQRGSLFESLRRKKTQTERKGGKF